MKPKKLAAFEEKNKNSWPFARKRTTNKKKTLMASDCFSSINGQCGKKFGKRFDNLDFIFL